MRKGGSREGGPKLPIERRPKVDQRRCGEGDEKGWVEGGWSKKAYLRWAVPYSETKTAELQTGIR